MSLPLGKPSCISGMLVPYQVASVFQRYRIANCRLLGIALVVAGGGGYLYLVFVEECLLLRVTNDESACAMLCI